MTHVAMLSLHTSPLDQPGSGDGGGLNVYVRELASSLARSGVICDVYTRAAGPNWPEVINVEPGFKVFNIEAGPLRPLSRFEFIDALDEITNKVIEAIITKNYDYDETLSAIHANYWLSALVGHEIKHRLEIPLITTFHTLEKVKMTQGQGDTDPVMSAKRIEAETMITACSDVVVASCDAEVADLLDLYSLEMDRLAVIAPGVEKAFFETGDKSFAKRALEVYLKVNYPVLTAESLDTSPLVLFAGRMQPLKGIDVAVGAIAMLEEFGIKNAKLLAVGGPSGPGSKEWYAELQSLVKDAGMAGDIIFLPPQQHEVLSTLYRAADCVVVPSKSESFGLVALEAMACGTPVVAANVGGLTTLIDSQQDGILIDRYDAGLYAGAIAQIISDDNLSGYFSKNAMAKASRYTWHSAAARLNYVYKGVFKKGIIRAC